jgi:hypothetical protein
MGIRVGVAVLVLLAFLTGDAVAQTYTCQPATSNAATVLRNYVVRLTGDPGYAQRRQLYQLPTATRSNVQVVTQSKTCKDAAQAYHAAVRGASAPPISRQVVVIKVGSTRYVVLDPKEQEGEYEITVIFNSSFQPLASFNS